MSYDQDDEPSQELIDDVERILIKALIERGYLSEKKCHNSQAILDAYESWVVDIRIQREEREEEPRRRKGKWLI